MPLRGDLFCGLSAQRLRMRRQAVRVASIIAVQPYRHMHAIYNFDALHAEGMLCKRYTENALSL